MKPNGESGMDGGGTSYLTKAFGGSPMVRVIDFLLENKIFDFTKVEIAKGSGVSRVTLEKIWSALEEMDLLIETRRIGNGILYTLNRESLIAKKMLELDEILVKGELDKHKSEVKK